MHIKNNNEERNDTTQHLSNAQNPLSKYKSLAALPLCFASTVWADSEPVDITNSTVTLEPIVVTEDYPATTSFNSSEITSDEIDRRRSAVSDTAQLLEDTPGISLYGAGGVSSLPVMHGLNDDRVKVEVNGMSITSACANHMNPPLAYIDRSNIGKINVMTGITPVSMGGDSIGGTIVVDSADPVFAEPGKDILLNGSLSSFYRSNGDAFGGSISAGVANQNARLDYTGSHTERANYQDGNGNTVQSSAYENQNHAATLSFKQDNHLLVIRGGQQHIPFQNFPNQRMDMTNNDSIFGNIRYKGAFDWGKLDGRFYIESTQHSMDIGEDKQKFAFAPPNNLMPMNTSGRNLGYKLMAEIPVSTRDKFRIGSEYHHNRINDWWPPVHTNTTRPMIPGMAGKMSSMYWMMAPEYFLNIHDGERERIAAFGEWEANWSPQWRTSLGLRYEHVNTNTGEVQPYNPNLLGGATAAGAGLNLRAAKAFNAQDRERNTYTFDVTALVQFTPNDMSQFELGYARKNRAPNLYERYTWGRRNMDMAMNGWFGDGNGYIGNIDLEPETAHILSFTASLADPKHGLWELKATPYFTYVHDFIDADRCPASLGGACATPGNQTANDRFVYLQYANHDAMLWGMDISGKASLYKDDFWGDFAARALMSYVRGERTNGGNLYHMMPFNAKLAIDHQRGGWKNTLEMQFVDRKDDVQDIRNELETPAYILLNARTSYTWEHLRFDVGLDNILDKQYYHPLSGAYIGDRFGMNPTGDPSTTVPFGRNVAGLGRSVYVGMNFTF
jgi:iron complex outermembrane recepter protein